MLCLENWGLGGGGGGGGVGERERREVSGMNVNHVM